MHRKLTEHANSMVVNFWERFLDRGTTIAQYVFILTSAVALAPFGSLLTKSPLQLAIGAFCYIGVFMLFLEVYCHLKTRRMLGGRVRASTMLLMAMPLTVSAMVLWIHYDEWFGPAAR